MSKTRVLAFVDHYLPGYKFGGPGRVLANMVELLGDTCEFRILTRDRDLGDDSPYPEIARGGWSRVGDAMVRYVAEGDVSLGSIRDVVRSTEHDVIYLNSAFSAPFTLKPLVCRRMGWLGSKPVIVAPRGEFSPGALAIKSGKKRVFLAAARACGLYNGVIWQALSDFEADEIRACFGAGAVVRLARDLVTIGLDQSEVTPRAEKAPGLVRAVFISRISRKKNLDGALRILARCDVDVSFDIYGPSEDAGYWRECEELMKKLPANVDARYHGGAAYEDVYGLLRSHDLFFLPTHGEGSATAALEALAAGCPVLISTNTPYRNLESIRVGWDVPLDRPEGFLEALRRCARMDAETHREWSEAAREYGLRMSRGEDVLVENRELFQFGEMSPSQAGLAQ